jgi:double-stranded uracil-DNA glycosylase
MKSPSTAQPSGKAATKSALYKLSDVLERDLRVIFVGTAAGKRSAERGEYYAGRGNRFWRTLHEVGRTPRLFEPSEFRGLLALDIGLTDMSKLGCGMDRDVKAHEFDPDLFEANVRRYRPRAIAFTSKKAASIWRRVSSTRGISFGRQAERPAGFPELFVLPSPSGAARSHWSLGPWRELAVWLKALS